jgi:hypothetical protein
MIILLIASGVFLVAFWLFMARRAYRKTQVMNELIRRRQQDYDREDLFNEKFQ